MFNQLKLKSMTSLQKKVLEMEIQNKFNEFNNDEFETQSLESNKHLQNILYGVWEDDYEEETLLSF